MPGSALTVWVGGKKVNLVVDFGYSPALAKPNNNKIKQIRRTEIEAKLVLETHAVCLGEHSGHHQQPPHRQELPHRQRRRER